MLSDVIDGVRLVGLRAPVAKGSPVRGAGYGVSLAVDGADPGHDMDAVFAVDVATDFESFRKAVLQMDVPAQNVVYADIDGHIGYQAPGPHPAATARAGPGPGPDGRHLAAAGVGLPLRLAPAVPAALAAAVRPDPKEGFLVAANQAVTAPGDGPFFTHDFDYGYRSQRIRDLLASAAKSGRKLQVRTCRPSRQDTYSGIAAELVPVLLKLNVNDAFTQQAVDLLKTWDYTEPTDSARPPTSTRCGPPCST